MAKNLCHCQYKHFLELLLDWPIHQTTCIILAKTDEWVYLISVDSRTSLLRMHSHQEGPTGYTREGFSGLQHISLQESVSRTGKAPLNILRMKFLLTISLGLLALSLPALSWPQDQLSEMEEYFAESQGLAATLVSFPLISLYSAYVLLA